MQKRGPIKSALLRIGSPQQIRSPLFNLRKFSETDKSTAASCRMHWNIMNNQEFGSLKCSKLKYRSGEKIIQPFCRTGSEKETRSSLFNLRKFSKTDKSSAESFRMHSNLMNDKEFGFFKCLKLKYRRRDQIIQSFCRIGSPQEIRSPLFNLKKFSKTDKSTAGSCKMHWNLMNDEEFWSLKSLKLKYRTADQIIQSFCRICSPQETSSPLFSFRKLSKTDKWLTVECIAI